MQSVLSIVLVVCKVPSLGVHHVQQLRLRLALHGQAPQHLLASHTAGLSAPTPLRFSRNRFEIAYQTLGMRTGVARGFNGG